jgi:chemotaxis protein MotB
MAVLAIVAAGACGVSQEAYDQRTTELDRCRQELTKSQGDLTAARARSDEEATEREHAAEVERRYLRLQQDLHATEKQLEDVKKARTQAEARSELYRNLTARLKPLADAKLLAVEVRGNKLLIRLPEPVLFDAGKMDIKPDGQNALRQVATALREIADRDFLVAAHTDNTPIRVAPYRSNWDFSTARAATVVRFLQQEGIDPRHLAAAGYSEFDPLVDNDYPTSKTLNRRVEIVVMPKVDEIPPIEVTVPLDTSMTPAPDASEPAPAPPSPAAPTPPAPAPPPR